MDDPKTLEERRRRVKAVLMKLSEERQEKRRRARMLLMKAQHHELAKLIEEKCLQPYGLTMDFLDAGVDYGYVYLLDMGCWVKIGMSDDPEERTKSLASRLPMDVVSIRYWLSPNKRKHERELHLEFAQQRVRSEWFELDHRAKERAVELLLGWGCVEFTDRGRNATDIDKAAPKG